MVSRRQGIKISVTAQGLTVEAQGYQGKACEAILNDLLPRLGMNPAEAEPKAEYWQQEQSQQQNLNQ
jgi:hypothetical protein